MSSDAGKRSSRSLQGSRKQGGSEMKLGVLSHSTTNPKWKFGSESRNLDPLPNPTAPLNRSESCPAMPSQASVMTTDAPTSTWLDGRSDDLGLESIESPSAYRSIGFSGLLSSKSASRGLNGGSNFSRCSAPRMDGSTDRFGDAPEHAAYPRAKSYDPSITMGVGANPVFEHGPHFSFRGGKSRLADIERMREQAERAKQLASQAQANAKREDKAKQLQKELMGDHETDEDRRRKEGARRIKKKTLSRGFGTEVRLRHRGGAMEMPITPGPAAYEISRDCDSTPEWLSSSLQPWGKRTANRPNLGNPSATAAGPGEYTAHHDPFAAAPSPLFGHPPRVLVQENYPDGGCYSPPCTFADASSSAISFAKETRTVSFLKHLKEVVTFTMKVKHLRYDVLTDDNILCTKFVDAAKQGIASHIGGRVAPQHVQIVLSPGSVILRCTVVPPTGTRATEVGAKIGSTPKQLAAAVEAEVSAVEGVDACCDDILHVCDLTKLTVQMGSADPGPGHFHSERLHAGVRGAERAFGFGLSERRHPADAVDPDEPPGPGAHIVRREPTHVDGQTTGLPTGEKLKTFGGMGPIGYPSPGDYVLPSEKAVSKTVSLPFQSKPSKVPGPGTYEPQQTHKEASPQWAPMHRTAPRGNPFIRRETGTEAASAAVMKRAMAAVEAKVKAEAQSSGKKFPEARFATTGPSWSLGTRRPLPGPTSEDCEAIYGATSSIGN